MYPVKMSANEFRNWKVMTHLLLKHIIPTVYEECNCREFFSRSLVCFCLCRAMRDYDVEAPNATFHQWLQTGVNNSPAVW